MSTDKVSAETTQATVRVNVGFFSTAIGVLMIAEFLCSMVAWSLLVSIYWFYYAGALNFAAFGLIFSWIATLIFLAVFATGIHDTLCANLPWGLIQVIANGLFAFLCFVSSCCVASYAYAFDVWKASTAFGFLTTILFIVSLLLSFRKNVGRFPWQSTHADQGVRVDM